MDIELARHKRRQAIDRIKALRQSGPSVPTDMIVELLRGAREQSQCPFVTTADYRGRP